MALASLNQLRPLRNALIRLRLLWLRLRCGVAAPASTSISLSSRFIAGRPGAISVGEDTLIAFKTLIIAADAASGTVRPIRIGRRCFVGGGAMILPGVTVGDESIIAAGAVVMDDVPPRSIVGGNPARVLRQGIEVGRFGRLKGADENSRRLYRL